MSNDQNGPAAGQNAMHIGQRLRADLTRAGYTDITVLPSSFMVHAKDLQGNPVMMVVSPDFGDRDHGRERARQFGQQLNSRGRQQQRRLDDRLRAVRRADETVKLTPAAPTKP